MILIVFLVVIIVLIGQAQDKKKKKIQQEALDAQPISQRADVAGSAKFIESESDLERCGLLGKRGIVLGHLIQNDKPVRFDQDSHTTVIAPSGTAKTTAFCIPNVLSLDHMSLFIMDAKTEICPTTIDHRASLGPVWILNSHETNMSYLKGYDLAQYSPTARLSDPKEPRINHSPIAQKISDGSIMAESSAEYETFWTGGAHALNSGFIIGQARYGAPEERSLPFVRRMLSGDVRGHCERLIAKNDPLVTDLLTQFLLGRKDRSSIDDVIATANVKTRFLADEGAAHMLGRSTFRFSQLKERISTVYVCGNIDFLDVTRSVFRLLMTCAFSELQRPDIPKKVPVWMLCDEAYHYGYSTTIETAYGAVRGAGVRLCTVWTDIAQIEKRYSGMSRTIIGNSGAVITMQTGDDQTAEFMSKNCGTSVVVTATPSVSANSMNWSKHVSHEPLFPLHEAMKLPADRLLVFVRGVGPVLLKKIQHFVQPHLRRKAGKNPYYQKKGLFNSLFGR